MSFAEVCGQVSNCTSNHRAKFQDVVIFVNDFKERGVDSLLSLSKVTVFESEIRIKMSYFNGPLFSVAFAGKSSV